ncbi:MAG TPA: hypothetical protein VLM83_05745 [Anaerolineales bacterium]|nr:hypothetical protein [Anaerolineales bacterium]
MSRLVEFAEDWKYFTERDGLQSSLPVIVSDIGELPYRHLRFVIVACSLLDPFPDWQPKIPLFIRPFEQMDLELVRQMNRPSEARLCAHRLTQGHKGLVAFNDGWLAGYAWGSTDIQTRLERVHPKLYPGDVLFTDSYTSPVFRGQGIQTALTLARFQLFGKLGYRRAISYIEVRNGPSLAVWQRKFNSQTIGTIDFKRIGPWYSVRITSGKNGN